MLYPEAVGKESLCYLLGRTEATPRLLQAHQNLPASRSVCGNERTGVSGGYCECVGKKNQRWFCFYVFGKKCSWFSRVCFSLTPAGSRQSRSLSHP